MSWCVWVARERGIVYVTGGPVKFLARRRERVCLARIQRRAWQVQDILVRCGLSQIGASIVGGQFFYVPHVVSVDLGSPERLKIRILPGQMPDDYAAHARRVAYSLGVTDVKVIQLAEPRMIQLELRR
jgi:hypothetical protein